MKSTNTRALIDINVLLDVLANRKPYVEAAAQIWIASETGSIKGLVCADSFSTLYYLLRKVSTKYKALKAMRMICDTFELVSLDNKIINQAIDSPITDFEDAIQSLSAMHGQANYIVTRDFKHFNKSSIPAIAPNDFINLLDSM